MAGLWDDSNGADYFSLTPGDVDASAAFTIAVLWLGDNTIGGFHNNDGIGLYASGSLKVGLSNQSGLLFSGPTDFSNGFGTETAVAYHVAAVCKPAGSAHFRFHEWVYAADASGTMTHGESTNSGNHADAGAGIDEIRLGQESVNTNGRIAVAAVWSSQLSDTDLDTLVSTSLADWAALSPDLLVSLEDGTCSVVAGSSTVSSTTGTISLGTDPSGFDYTLTTATPSGAGALGVAWSVDGAGSASHSGTGALGTDWAVDGAGSATHAGTGALGVDWSADGAGSTTHSGTGALGVAWAVDGAGAAPTSAVPAGTGALELAWAVDGSGSTDHAGDGALSALWAIDGAGSSQHSGDGALSVGWTARGRGGVPHGMKGTASGPAAHMPGEVDTPATVGLLGSVA